MDGVSRAGVRGIRNAWVTASRRGDARPRRRTVHCGRSVNGRVIELLPFTAKDAKDANAQVNRRGS
jgi:hypothetical protein